MKVGVKLNIAFYSIILVMIITAVVVTINLNTIEDKQEEALDYRVEQIRVVDNIRVNLGMQGLYARELVIQNNQSNHDDLMKYAKNLDEDIEKMKTLISSKEMEQYVEEISIHNEDFNTGIDDLLKSLDSDDNKKV